MKAFEYAIWCSLAGLSYGCPAWDPAGDSRLIISNKTDRPIYYSIASCTAPDSTVYVPASKRLSIPGFEQDTIRDKPGDNYLPPFSSERATTGPGGKWPEEVHRSGGYLCIYFFAADDVDQWPPRSGLKVLEKQRISLDQLNASNWIIVYPHSSP